MLGLKEIPAVIIRSETTTIEDNKGEKQRIALMENLHRKDLSDIEKAEGILSVYTNAGYRPDNVICMIKSLDNRGYESGTTTDRILILSSLGKRYLNETDTNNSKNEPAISEKFLDIADSIGCAPNTQYKYLQIVVKLEPSILKKAEDKGLSLNKKNMLINKVSNKHPRIQKQIIDEIAYKPEKEARIKVNQAIRDLEKEAIVQDEANNYVYNYGKREKVTEKMVDDTKAALRFLEISRKIKELMYLLIGHRLT